MSHFFEHSELVKAQKTPQPTGSLWASIKERFEACPLGMSFAVEANETFTASQLRTVVSRRAKSAGKVFSVVKHTNGEGQTFYEVAYRDTLAEVSKANPAAETVGWQPNTNGSNSPWAN
jgi:hypothetical protein